MCLGRHRPSHKSVGAEQGSTAGQGDQEVLMCAAGAPWRAAGSPSWCPSTHGSTSRTLPAMAQRPPLRSDPLLLDRLLCLRQSQVRPSVLPAQRIPHLCAFSKYASTQGLMRQTGMLLNKSPENAKYLFPACQAGPRWRLRICHARPSPAPAALPGTRPGQPPRDLQGHSWHSEHFTAAQSMTRMC